MKLTAKRLLAMGIAVLLCMSTMGIMATAETNKVSYSMETAMEDFTIVSDETKTQISVVSDEIIGNTDKKLKIENKEDTVTTVSIPYLDLSGVDTDRYSGTLEVYWDFYLESLDNPENNDSKGVMLDMVRPSGEETEYFGDTTYNYFRKMLVFKTGTVYDTEVKATFSGKGTLYLGNVVIMRDNIVINGSLEGVSGDGKIANIATSNSSTGWATTDGTVGYWREGTDEPTANGWYLAETSKGNYIMGIGTARSGGARYIDTAPVLLTDGTVYKISVSQKADAINNGGIGFSNFRDFRMPIVSSKKSAHWAYPTTVWADKSMNVIYDTTTNSTDSRIGINMHARLGTNGKVYIDNLRIEPAEEETAYLTDVEGEVKSNLINGEKMTVNYTMSPWTASEEWATLTDTTKSKKSLALIGVLYKKDGGSNKIEDIAIIPEAVGEVIASTDSIWEHAGVYDIGLVPIDFDFTFEVPQEGEYMVKLFTWDNVSGLKPATDAKYVFTTAIPEA